MLAVRLVVRLDEWHQRIRRQQRRILRDEAALSSYVADGWPIWRIAEKHHLQRYEVRRAMVKYGIEGREA